MSGNRYCWYAATGKTTAQAEAKRAFGKPGLVATNVDKPEGEYDSYVVKTDRHVVVYWGSVGRDFEDEVRAIAASAGNSIYYCWEDIVGSAYLVAFEAGVEAWSVYADYEQAIFKGTVPGELRSITRIDGLEDLVGEITGFDRDETYPHYVVMEPPVRPEPADVTTLESSLGTFASPTIDQVIAAIDALEPGRRLRISVPNGSQLGIAFVDGKLALDVREQRRYIALTDQRDAIIAAADHFIETGERTPSLTWQRP